MRLCDEDMVAAFLKVSTPNQWESKRHVWFDFLDGMSPEHVRDLKVWPPGFFLTWLLGCAYGR